MKDEYVVQPTLIKPHNPYLELKLPNILFQGKRITFEFNLNFSFNSKLALVIYFLPLVLYMIEYVVS